MISIPKTGFSPAWAKPNESPPAPEKIDITQSFMRYKLNPMYQYDSLTIIFN
ncbi:hypothetical protein NUACC21_45390 [Scytonema sp. NUACC21]